MIKKFFRWIFKDELAQLNIKLEEANKINETWGIAEVGLDVNYNSRSWAVISIQGKKNDFIKFIDLGQAEISEIQRFLHRFDRRKIDANPQTTRFLKI